MKRKDHDWRCECGGGHFLSVAWWPEDLDRGLEIEGYLAVEGDFRDSWRHRLRWAWKLLRSGHSATYVGLVLDAAKAREIAGVLEEFARAAEKEER